MKNILAGNIRRLRKKKKMSQNALAERAEISFRGLQAIEYGITWPGIETITAIAHALDVSEVELFQDLEHLPAPTPEQAVTILSQFVREKSSKI